MMVGCMVTACTILLSLTPVTAFCTDGAKPSPTAMAFVATFAAPPRDWFPSVQPTRSDRPASKWARRIDARSTADGRRCCAGGLVRMAREDDVSGSITNPVDPAAEGELLPLPEGWASAVDHSSGQIYYYSEEGETTWTRPVDGSQAGKNETHQLSGFSSFDFELFLVSRRRNFLKNIALWFAVSWFFQLVFPDRIFERPQTKKMPGAISVAPHDDDVSAASEIKAAAEEALTNSAQAEVVELWSTTLAEFVADVLGAEVAGPFVPLLRPLALFLTDLAIDMQEEMNAERLAEEQRKKQSWLQPWLKEDTKPHSGLPGAIKNAARGTSNVMVSRSAAGQLMASGSLGHILEAGTVTKILIKTLDKVERVLMEFAPPEWWEEYQKQPGRARARMLRSLRAGVLPTQRKPWAWSWKERAGKGNGGQWDFWSR